MAASIASGGLLPPPVDKPSIARLEAIARVVGALARRTGARGLQDPAGALRALARGSLAPGEALSLVPPPPPPLI